METIIITTAAVLAVIVVVVTALVAYPCVKAVLKMLR